jgi:hypothetical protein
MKVFAAARPTAGEIALTPDSRVFVQSRYRDAGVAMGKMLVLAHEYKDIEFTEANELLVVPKARKFVIDLDDSSQTTIPTSIAYKSYDLTPELEKELAIREMHDTDFVDKFVSKYSTVEVGMAARDSRIEGLRVYLRRLHALRFEDVPPVPGRTTGLHLWAAQQMRHLLEEVSEAQPRHNAQVTVSREHED